MSFVNYKNGNYVVYFNTETGDKIRKTNASEFRPSFAENCDVTITNKCDGNCSFCYAGCTPSGKHGDLNASFFETLHPYTELAINGNDLSHPGLIPFLEKMKKKRIIINMTVNQIHFERNLNTIKDLQRRGLINGVGVSLIKACQSLIDKIKECNNVVIHVINGVVSASDIEMLTGNDLDLLILGYKTTGRGHDYLINHDEEIMLKQKWLFENIGIVFDGFRTVEFDNLAIEQLSIKERVTAEQWDLHYMGDDGTVTFFINVVDGYFAKNSTSEIHYPLMNSIDEMFRFLQEVKNYEE